MMAGPDTQWATNLFSGNGGNASDLAQARRRYELLKAELEAIRAGRKEANRAELRRLEADLAKAQEEIRTAQAAQVGVAPKGPTAGGLTTYGPGVGAPGQINRAPPGARAAAGGTYGPSPGGGVSPFGGVPAGGGISDVLRGLAGRPGAGAGVMATGKPTPQTIAGALQAKPQIGGFAGWIENLFGGGQPSSMGVQPPQGNVPGAMLGGNLGTASKTTGARLTWRDKPMDQWTTNDFLAYEDYQRQQANRMTEYQQASLAQQQAQAAAQQAHQQAQLQQAWAIAQQELAHAQNVMAASIGTQSAQIQSQSWAQGLPHELPRGTTVAPGFERGGPASQLYRMSGSQFNPGTTGKIAPSPAPSMSDIMGWVQQAMGKYGG